MPDAPLGGCPNWPEAMRLRSSQGEYVRGRCTSVNKCHYCAVLGAVENTECLMLDALNDGAPECMAILTTGNIDQRPRRYYEARKAVFEAVWEVWPDMQWSSLLEFTTGEAVTSGGHRRIHWNIIFKNVPAADAAQLREVVVSTWCAQSVTRAVPRGQMVDAIKSAGGWIGYVAQHFQKSSQAPPKGWSGHRFTHSRRGAGYFGRPMPEVRAEARESLARKRDLRKIIELHDGRSAEQIAADVEHLAAVRAETTWELVHAEKVLTASTTAGQSDELRSLLREAAAALTRARWLPLHEVGLQRSLDQELGHRIRARAP